MSTSASPLARRFVRLAGVVASLAVVVVSASADGAERESKVKGKGSGNIRVSDADRGVQELDLQNIEGRIYKPAVFVVLARSEFKYGGLEFRQNFVDRIVRGALKRPF